LIWALAGAAAFLWGNSAGAHQPYASRHENVLGTTLDLVIDAENYEVAEGAETTVLAEIDRLAAILSTWVETSEFSQWRRAPKIPAVVSPELFDVLELCDKWRIESAGAFNACAQSVCAVWKQAAQNDRVPTSSELERAVLSAGSSPWKLDGELRTAQRLTDCPLTLDALAKGYIVEMAASAVMQKTAGVRGIVVAIGGDLRVCGSIDREVLITDPFADADNAPAVARVVVREKAVATSGGYRRGVRIGGRWYSHIVDPRTGLPVDHIASSTAIANHAADADALATIFNVLTVEQSLRLAEKIPGVACLLITREGKMIASERWWQFASAQAAELRAISPASQSAGSAAAAAVPQAEDGKPDDRSDLPVALVEPPQKQKSPELQPDKWSPDFELLVQFEINQPAGGGRYKRPYVAVWIENKEGLPVRTLAVWLKSGKGQRWLPDLRRWHRDDKKRRETDDTDVLPTVSGATRAPGKYKLLWDGKDDAGKVVASGKYSVFIEAAREHGTYQLVKEDVEVTGTPFTSELKENVEIKGASLEYRRKSAPAGK
jgi:thiamine biosynthesis lipoprotein ApbE